MRATHRFYLWGTLQSQTLLWFPKSYFDGNKNSKGMQEYQISRQAALQPAAETETWKMLCMHFFIQYITQLFKSEKMNVVLFDHAFTSIKLHFFIFIKKI